ncbi:MAG: 1-acyl-sn-glycerol-3-phosphate acyltransferase [Proteobacteria bacterium]|nr:MAG: 1-acyl-sn-glycerol-3-phosphate acyltransferase [Pseudomonadota bacterium]
MTVSIVTRVRAIFGLTFAILHTAFFSTLVFAAGFANKQKLATKIITFWAKLVFKVFGIEVVTSGEENLPAQSGGIIVFNHQSHFDITALCASTEKQIRFGAKIELFKIPIFGPAMRSVGTLPIARENRSEVMRIYEDAAKRFREGTLFILAPEGTRQPEPKIGRFKKGPFIFATNAKVPIIPAVIRGAYEVLPRKTMLINVGKWKRQIHVQYLPPIETSGYSSRDIEPLVQKTREQMVAAYEALPSDG